MAAQHRSVLLIRGINVGSTRKVPMADLRSICTDAGCTDVRTYIQSGNAVLSTSLPDTRLGEAIAVGIESRFGFRPSVMVRRPEALHRVLDTRPFGDVDTDRLHVGFLSGPVAPAALARLDDVDIAPEQFAVVGTELFLHLPDGMGRSRFGKVPFARLLEVDITVRNWRTVTTLAEMAAD